jgi:hypothetical protein
MPYGVRKTSVASTNGCLLSHSFDENHPHNITSHTNRPFQKGNFTGQMIVVCVQFSTKRS